MADDWASGLGGNTPGGSSQGGGTNAGTTADILRNQVLSQLAVTLDQLVTALQVAFPQASASVTTTATAGLQTLPAKPAAFLTITVSGTAYKLPLYNP